MFRWFRKRGVKRGQEPYGSPLIRDELSAVIFIAGVIGGLMSIQKRRLRDEPLIVAALIKLGLPQRYVDALGGGEHGEQANDKNSGSAVRGVQQNTDQRPG